MTEKKEFELPENAILQDDGSVLLKLSEAVEVSGEEVSELTFKKLLGGDVVDILGIRDDGKSTLAVIKRSLKMNDLKGEKLIRRLDSGDFIKASQIAGNFLKGGRIKQD